MPIRKSIRDIQTSNTISDIVSPETIKTNTPRTKKIEKNIEPSQPVQEYIPEEVLSSVESVGSSQAPSTSTNKKSIYKIILKSLFQIKPVYLISFGIILLGVAILIFIPSNSTRDPLEQSKKEAEVVKKQFSKHIILPENEQIDIRKITNKMEDPFFKDAEVGDYLIIFYKNRIAYIYSIDKDIIVNAGVVFIDPKTATTTSTTKTQ
jgi:hypothetical protein